MKRTILALFVFLFALTHQFATAKSKGNKKLLYTFVAVGCNRVDKGDVKPENPSTANVEQLIQTFNDVANLSPLPDYFFFLGDIVMGYVKDTAILGRELRAWKTLYLQSALSKTKIKMIVVPGNHELFIGKNKPANETNEKCWVDNMKEFLPTSNGPTIGGNDTLKSDQSKLSGSFDFKGSHFVLCNTDGVGMESKIPLYWVAKDLKSANQTKPIFIFSHEPCLSTSDEKGIDTAKGFRNKVWNVFEQNHVTAMISAHCHLFFTKQLHQKSTWQIISGNGGSQLEKEVTKPEERYYGFVLIKVFKNQKVEMISFGRNFDEKNYLAKPTSATTIRETKILTE